MLRDITLQLGAFGTLRLDPEIVAPRRVYTSKGDERFVMGCRFVEVPRAAVPTLQRVIAQRETKRQRLAPQR